MSKKFFVLLFCLLFLFVQVVSSKEINSKLLNKVIVLDAGHGGKDCGTTIRDICEDDINFSIVKKIEKRLLENGAIVLLTRDGDYDLSSPDINKRKKSDFDNRISFINSSNADLYFSIHINYFEDSRYYGAQVFYSEGNEYLAKVVQKSFQEYLNSPLQEKKISKDLYMYNKLNVKGLLLECGFLSNNSERIKLMDEEYQDMIANSLIKALLQYY